ncbi:MAG: AAA family ATPase [Clostridia bacterium]|nr:AAA family ATPase [Clostridia bacterium]
MPNNTNENTNSSAGRDDILDFIDEMEDEYELSKNYRRTLAEKCGDFLAEWPLARLIGYFKEYIGGQDGAITAFAMALREHLALTANPQLELRKRNVLIYGPTGSGKTELLRVAARIVPVPVVIEDASTLTPTGFRGRNKQDLLQNLFSRYGDDARYAIVFLDEFDKLCASPDATVDAFRKSTQHDLLKMVEGETLPNTRRGALLSEAKEFCTDNMMFVCGGVFDGAFAAPAPRRAIGFLADFDAERGTDSPSERDANEPLDTNEAISRLIEFGMLAEFAGRLNHVIHIRPLSEEDLYGILTEKKNTALENLRRTFRAAYGVELNFTARALRTACRQAFRRRLGARGLSALLDDAAHKALLGASGEELVVDA